MYWFFLINSPNDPNTPTYVKWKAILLTCHLLYILATIKQVCENYHRRIDDLENKKFDLEKEVEFRDFQVEWALWRACYIAHA